MVLDLTLLRPFFTFRQTVCPLPSWAAAIVRLRGNGSTPTVGVGAYSEGLGDDLNKAIWSAIAEDPTLTADEVTRQYARYFFGTAHEDTWHAALRGLESNWEGTPDNANAVIPATLALLEKATAGGNPAPKDWRAQMYLKRGYGTFRPNFHRFDRLELDLRGHT